MIYGELIKENNNNDAILEALEFIEEDYSQLLEEKNNEILDENHIYLNEGYKEFYRQVGQFSKDMGKYRKEYKQAVKQKDKNKINNVVKDMRKSIKRTKDLIDNNTDTDIYDFIVSWFTGGFLSTLRMFIPTFVYAAAVYGVNISPITGKIDKSGKVTAVVYYISMGIVPVIRNIMDMIGHIKAFGDRLSKGDVLGSMDHNRRIIIQYLNEFDKIVSKLEVKSEKDLEPKK